MARYVPIPGDRSGGTTFVAHEVIVNERLGTPSYSWLGEIGRVEKTFTITAPNIHSSANVNYDPIGGSSPQHVERGLWSWTATQQ